MEIEVCSENLKFLECFSSPTRVRIIELLGAEAMNIKSLSEALDIKSPIVTRHIHMLEQAGIVRSEIVAGKRGKQKICHLDLSQATLRFRKHAVATERSRYFVSLPVGAYSSYEVKPTCGIASANNMIGMCDDPRYFADPEHVHARVLWFGIGYVEYRIPNYMVNNEKPDTLEVSLEICSETPCTVDHLPTDIVFSMNGTEIGTWTYPGNFGNDRGIYTPAWWYKNIHHGLMKTIRITQHGSFIDGVKVSGVTISDLALSYDKEILFRISCSATARNCGGVTLFGKGFGNYNQDIEVTLRCL
ncbi:transcriptional regulator [Paenibacillus agaridevorans]|uniref:Transcriptional regulator n=1 Tax=Paenibacillus agaridevorans TaxID=171404 RepID=A0A2R5F1H4_9BACL|nr:helix-turn-helix domain-containing protein [Paenibacillus agaridevorans]GBG12315.1 transcriptional regulator [Paenibacillus agaridevorans]